MTDRTTAVDGSEDTGTVDMGYHYLNTAQSAYAIGWLGGGSNGWKTGSAPSRGSDYKSFYLPTRVFADTFGNIYVTEKLNHRVSKWDSAGNAIGWIGGGSDGWKITSGASSGNGYQSFNHPNGVFVDLYSNIFVCDRLNNRISKWDSSGKAIGWLGGQINGWETTSGASHGSDYQSFEQPYDVFVDKGGNIFVADCFNKRISKWDNNANALGWIGGASIGWQNGVAPSSANDYQSFYNSIGVFVDSTGNIYIADQVNHRISKWQD